MPPKSALAKNEFAREVVICIFYVVNTLVAVMAAFLITAGAVAFLLALSLSPASTELVQSEPGLKDLLVIGGKMFGLAALSVGSVQLIVVHVGCCGMVHKAFTVLTMYGVLCFLLAILNLAIAGYISFQIYQVNSDQWFKNKLLDTIKNYDGKDNFNTFFVDYTQVKLSCCAVFGVEEYNQSRWYATGNREVPFSCCQTKSQKIVSSFDFAKRKLTKEDLLDSNCPTRPAGKSFTTVPCYEKIKNMTYSAYVTGIAAALFSMVLQCCIGYIAFRIVGSLKKS